MRSTITRRALTALLLTITSLAVVPSAGAQQYPPDPATAPAPEVDQPVDPRTGVAYEVDAALLGISLGLLDIDSLLELRSGHASFAQAFLLRVGDVAAAGGLVLEANGVLATSGERIDLRLRPGDPLVLALCCVEGDRLAVFELEADSGIVGLRSGTSSPAHTLGVSLTDSSGVAVLQSEVPRDADPGRHLIVARSIASDGTVATLTSEIEILGDETSRWIWWLVPATGAAILLLALVLLKRRSRSAESTA